MYVKESGNGLDDIKNAIAFFAANRCYVGIPSSNSSRDSKTITNAELAFIHSRGSPRLRIPARPFIEPAIEQADTQSKISRHLKASVIAAIDGDMDTALSELDKAGSAGENASHDYIGSGHHVKNSPFTINGGWGRNRISGKIFYAKPKKSNVPLIDTGSLRSSITHVIKKR